MSEIKYAIEHEMAMKPNDIICRRIPLAFLNKQAAEDLLSVIVSEMSNHFSWTPEESAMHLLEAKQNLEYQK
jgi:glycerol-3-phosphate dehydrogenase